MIKYITGNLFDSKAIALVNTVNTQGVMGKGIALQFKERYPSNYRLYREACKRGDVEVGTMFITQEREMTGKLRTIINFPTKKHWRFPSKYEYIEDGLKDLKAKIVELNIKSIAIPPLGSSNGGLDWSMVKPMIIKALDGIDCEVEIYEPTKVIQEKMKKERAKLTPARAMLLMVMSDMTTEQENPSEFAAEKIAYFLQKFGAQDQFRLRFNKAYYGPYSGKVRYVLHYLNGSYIMGMEAMSNHPFDEIRMTDDAAIIAKRYLSQDENLKYLEIAQKTMDFLRGYYSNYLLELLATTSYLMDSDPRMTDKIAEDEQVKIISKDLMQWSNRKDKLFNSGKAIRLALKHIKEADFVSNLSTATELGQ